MKRQAHLTAVLVGFKKVDPYDRIFPPPKPSRPRAATGQELGRFLNRFVDPKFKKE